MVVFSIVVIVIISVGRVCCYLENVWFDLSVVKVGVDILIVGIFLMIWGVKFLDFDVRVFSLLFVRMVVVFGFEFIYDDMDRIIVCVEFFFMDEFIVVVLFDEVVKDIFCVDVVGVGFVFVVFDFLLVCGRVGDCDEGWSSMLLVYCVGGVVLWDFLLEDILGNGVLVNNIVVKFKWDVYGCN